MFVMLMLIFIAFFIYFMNDLRPFVKFLPINNNINDQQLVDNPNKKMDE